MTSRRHPAGLAPPQNETAEIALLGSFLTDPRRLGRVPVSEEHFYSDRHRRVLRALLALDARGERVDLVTVEAELARQSRRGDSAIRASDLADLAQQDGVLPEEHFRLLEDCRRRRELLLLGQTVIQIATTPAVDLDDDLPVTVERLGRILAAGHADQHVHALPAVIGRRAQELMTRPAENIESVETGFRAFDELGGFPRRELTVLAARPGMGKSALVHQIATHVARAGRHVLLCTPEMSAAQVADRLIAQGADVPLRHLRRGDLSEPEWRRVAQTAAAAPEVVLFDAGAMTTREIHALARRLMLRRALDLIVVDHLQYLADEGRGPDNRTAVVGRMVRSLKGLARVTGAALVLLSQLNRKSEDRKDKRPELADLRDSGDIEQDADVVLLLHRPAYYDKTDQPGRAEVIVAKARNGPTGRRLLVWDERTTRFLDVQSPDQSHDNGRGDQSDAWWSR